MLLSPKRSLLKRPAIVAASSFATWNSADVGSGITLDGTKLIASNGTGGTTNVAGRATVSKSAGKWVYEYTVSAFAAAEHNVGWASGGMALSTGELFGGTNRAGYRLGDSLYFNASAAAFQGGVLSSVIMLCIDFSANLIWATLDGTNWSGAGNPATGTGGRSIAGLTGTPWFPAFVMSNAGKNEVTARFDPATFTYASTYSTLNAAGFNGWS